MDWEIILWMLPVGGLGWWLGYASSKHYRRKKPGGGKGE
jgi:hypothetical protein